ncbi:MAG: protein kinase [Thermoanaerobaculales bacterium]|jgi:serine/threonine-protein kinase|nr:protein kinase [Thermoanaerobaculales bacterium]
MMSRAEPSPDRRPPLARVAERVLRLAVGRGLIDAGAADSTLVEVRRQLADHGLQEPTLRGFISPELIDDDTLARLAKEAEAQELADGMVVDDTTADKARPVRPGAGGADPFERFPVTDWDRYEIEEFIGRGGMGDVFKARDPRLGRYVALKFLRRDDPELIERFTREAQAQARIDHDNVCPVYEVGEVQGHSYIAMQYVAGGSLKQITDLLSLGQKVQIMRAVAEALHAAHLAGLIHRDIKPGNILVEHQPDEGWRPFIVDFGIARDIEGHDLTVTGMVLGTPAFCAPEQVRGETSKLDWRTDVYGVGATLYWFVTGKSPYEGGYPEIITGVTEREPEPPHRLNADVPVDLETIILKCLEKEPDRRYATAREVAEDLERFLAGEPIQARRASLLYKVSKKIRKHKVLTAVAVAAAGIMVILAALGIRAEIEGRRRATVAEHFVGQAKEIESLARVAAMMPLHDRSSERRSILARMDAIRNEMAAGGEIAFGPGHYALGRGHLILENLDEAEEHLRLALAVGYDSPGVASSLGLVLGRLYERELRLARRIADPELRAARVSQIERELRDEALALLRRSSGLGIEEPAYVEGLIAYYGGDLETALAKADQAAGNAEWLYEAAKLGADIHLEMGTELALGGDYDGAMAAFSRAGAAYEAAADIARSDPAIQEGDCGRWTLVMEVEGRRGVTAEGAFARAVAACDRAVAIDPNRAGVHERLARLHWMRADLANDRGEDPVPYLDNAIQAAERAIEIEPESAVAHATLGGTLVVVAQHRQDRGLDPQPELRRAIESLQRAVDLDPTSVLSYDDLGYAWERTAKYEMSVGLDPRSSLDRALEAFRRATELEPRYANAHNNAGIARWRAAVFEHRTGASPFATLAGAISSFDRAIERNPNYHYAHANRGLAWRTLALVELEAGRDPTDAVQAARSDLARALELNPNISFAYPELVAAEVIAARWAMANGRSGERELRDAERAARRGLEVNPQNPIAYQSAAEVARWRAEAALLRGEPVAAEVRRGRRLVYEALARNPSLASALVTDAGLLIVEAESDPARRDELFRAARTRLDQASRLNPLIQREIDELSARISRPR